MKLARVGANERFGQLVYLDDWRLLVGHDDLMTLPLASQGSTLLFPLDWATQLFHSFFGIAGVDKLADIDGVSVAQFILVGEEGL